MLLFPTHCVLPTIPCETRVSSLCTYLQPAPSLPCNRKGVTTLLEPWSSSTPALLMCSHQQHRYHQLMILRSIITSHAERYQKAISQNPIGMSRSSAALRRQTNRTYSASIGGITANCCSPSSSSVMNVCPGCLFHSMSKLVVLSCALPPTPASAPVLASTPAQTPPSEVSNTKWRTDRGPCGRTGIDMDTP